ncbi:hypothetical protein PR003_g25136 [Phytophthora rubi]|uniref:Uncharacterized protein n=1 Tax=Phytophthora rubi TaxID=129364 RepID=A0A6A4CMM4_9STRA|nr:hypothetical protein PR001_g23776 [Phytophthora rubi]KAE9291057.1 hypothetical protein PR003_g25136 [Phytophthora rubi]
MDLLDVIQNEVLKQKEEEALNNFSRVSDFRGFISESRPDPDVSVTLKLCCLSAERLKGGHGTRFTGVDASQRAEFEPTSNALADLTPLKRKPYIAQVTVWDAKTKKGSFSKTNIEFQPGAVYVFRQVDGVGFYADIAKGNVQYERDTPDKVFEQEPPLKKRKLDRVPSKNPGKSKAQVVATGKRPAGVEEIGDDILMATEEKEAEPRDLGSTRSMRSNPLSV